MLRRILIICLIVSGLTFVQRHYAFEDALIYARYIRNALAGHGLVFNPGEHINALTSPLFGCLLVVVSWLLHGHILAANMVLSATFLVGASSIAEAIAPWSGMVIASTGYFYICFGMETTLFLFLLALCVWLFVSERYGWLPLVCLLTLLTRFEGVFLLIPILWQLWQRKTWPPLASYAAPAIIAAGYLLFNVHFYGRLLPASASAKFEHGLSGYWGRWPTAFLHHGSALMLPFLYSIYVVPAAVILAAIAVRRLRGNPINTIVLPFFFSLLAFYILLNIPNYHWYDAPFIFFGLIYAVLGLRTFRFGKEGLANWILTAVVAECAVAAVFYLRAETQIRHYQNIAHWLNDHTAPDAKVAAVEIGTIGWYCDRNLDDIIGLTNPENAKLLARHDLTSWLENDKPDYVVVHTPPAYGEAAAVASPFYEREPVSFDGVGILHRKGSPR